MKNLSKWLLILIPVVWVFKHVLFGSLSSWGDAPFFYSEGLRELFMEPLTWTQRGLNFGGVNQLLWLSPVMILYGALGRFLSLDNSAIVRILFYFPSIFLSTTGTYLLAKYLRFSKTTQFFSILVYLLNTYYLLVIDGGQMGVALAYGIFPFIILLGRKMLDGISINSFFIFLFSSFILTAVDPRVFVVAFVCMVVWQILENWKKIWILILAGVLLIPLNLYWIYPALKIGSQGISLDVVGLQLSSILNALFLYAPHWPGNEFGKVIQPAFYFALVPLLIFGSFLFKQKNRTFLNLCLVFLFSAFVSKGSTPPLGGFYDLVVNKIPLGFAFRDSSKFFIPVVLFGGILIGETLERLKSKIKILPAIVYVFLLLLIGPAILGKLSFVLSGKEAGNDFEKIYRNLKDESGFFRTMWFPQRHPLAFETMEKPVLDARELVTFAPFAQMNASEDVFNFLNNQKFPGWLKRFGVKYLIFSGDPRNLTPTQKDIENWEKVKKLAGESPGLIKMDWGTNFPIYKIENPLPRFYKVNSLIAVVGPYLDSERPSVYFEDGKLDPKLLEGKNPDSIKLYFNGKDNLDLTASFLRKYFVSAGEAVDSHWAYYPHQKYLKAKYELLIRGVAYRDFDYGKGIAFSTQKGEAMKFKFNVDQDGDFVLAARLIAQGAKSLGWKLEEKNLKKGKMEYEVVNQSGLEVFNVVALIPKKDFDEATRLGESLIKNFGVIREKDLSSDDWEEAGVTPEGILKYKFNPGSTGYWIIFPDSYHPLWKFKEGIEYFDSVPVYSAINGFYFDPKWGDLHIEFDGQRIFRWGVYFSVISVLGLSIVYLLKKNG